MRYFWPVKTNSKLLFSELLHDFYYEHTWDFISELRYFIMAKDFVHTCSDGQKKCFQINDTLEYAMLKMNPKCPTCGKSLVTLNQ